MSANYSPPDSLNFAPLSAAYVADEDETLRNLIQFAGLDETSRTAISAHASKLVHGIRAQSKRLDLIDALLQQYGLSTDEGVTLMRLAEALIRTPDFATSRALIRDKIGAGEWERHVGKSPAALVNSATQGLRLSSFWIEATGGAAAKNITAKLGDRIMNKAVAAAMAMMGDHFVLGRTIKEATAKARNNEAEGFSHSYDMLGEAAHTSADAERYFFSYKRAIEHLAALDRQSTTAADAPSISVKLSALHPRYELAQANACIPMLLDRLQTLAIIAKGANLGLTIDAEETDRLELSLTIVHALLADPMLAGWDGLGIVVQAYQRRAMPTLDWLIAAARAQSRKINVRLVKGAYWDYEIKRAQELGLESYPVFTRKENTDVSYLACARRLLTAPDVIYPQFATHNAHTTSAILHMSGSDRNFEFQRLHGMGEALHTDLMRHSDVKSRVYAPVGDHKNLLPYLVRRLLENGANSSFVNQLLDLDVEVDEIVRDPITVATDNKSASNPNIPAPRELFNGERLSALGLDLTQTRQAAHIEAAAQHPPFIEARTIVNGEERGEEPEGIENPAVRNAKVGIAFPATTQDVDDAIKISKACSWGQSATATERSDILLTAAQMLEDEMPRLIALCTAEAGKSMPDGVAEIREAVDFCRYYAHRAKAPAMTERAPLGPVACISPWNFPLAIFLGQVTAALAAGNTVIAKPAEQTPLIAYEAVKLLHRAGIPNDALHLVIGDGEIGAHLTGHNDIAGVCFTGSTATAKHIAAGLADNDRADIPLIAETGGLNVMIIDSTALIEQAVQDVIDSSFQSAGQRCSACRLVVVQDDIADQFIEMLAGAMAELRLGDPRKLSTDVGPVIDAEAHSAILKYCESARQRFSVIGETHATDGNEDGFYINPIAFEVSAINDLEQEIFGPVLHVMRFKSTDFYPMLEAVNALGYGLTMGLHTRLDSRVDEIAERAKVGNLYVNRNQIGAVVGVQPFGGEGLSGTGPKAGGPHYLLRLSHSNAALSLSQSTHTTVPERSDHSENDRMSGSRIKTIKEAQLDWSGKDPIAVLDKTIATMRNKDELSLVANHQAALLRGQINLPGPTGERNSLKLYPRGILALYASNDRKILDKQMILSLASGNAIIAFATAENRQHIEGFIHTLEHAGAPKNLVTLGTETDWDIILTMDIAGAIAEGGDRTAIANALARRNGAILPLLSIYDPPARFFHERTLTVNTTAAGGNASLLALTA